VDRLEAIEVGDNVVADVAVVDFFIGIISPGKKKKRDWKNTEMS
jgi:hypothetical protein